MQSSSSRVRQTADNHCSPQSTDDRPAAGLRTSSDLRTSLHEESETWYDYSDSGAGESPDTPGSGRGSAWARSNHASNEWYRHNHDDEDSGSGSSTPTSSSAGRRPGRNDDAKRLALAAGGDPNDWYRHDHNSNPVSRQKGGSSPPGKGTPTANGTTTANQKSPLWFASDGVWYQDNADEESIGKSTAFSPKNRHADPAASEYYRRDKLGSSGEWFRHDQEASATPAGNGSGSGVDAEHQRPVSASGRRGTAEDIARRLKAESEDWFVYDGPGEGGRSPSALAAKATSPEVRRMQARNTGDEMKQTLRIDDNIKQPASVVGQTSKSGAR